MGAHRSVECIYMYVCTCCTHRYRDDVIDTIGNHSLMWYVSTGVDG